MDVYKNTQQAFWKRDSHDWWQNYCAMVNTAVEYGVHYNEIASAGETVVQDRPGSGRWSSGRFGSVRLGSGRVGSGMTGSGRLGSGRIGSGRISSAMSSRSMSSRMGSRSGSYRGSGVNLGVCGLGYGIRLI